MRNHLTRIWSQILLYVNHKTVSHENISYDLPIRNLVPNSCKMISHLFFIRILLFPSGWDNSSLCRNSSYI